MGIPEIISFTKSLDEVLRPIVEEWSETKLEFSETYGVRRYKHGARLVGLVYLYIYGVHIYKHGARLVGLVYLYIWSTHIYKHGARLVGLVYLYIWSTL